MFARRPLFIGQSRAFARLLGYPSLRILQVDDEKTRSTRQSKASITSDCAVVRLVTAFGWLKDKTFKLALVELTEMMAHQRQRRSSQSSSRHLQQPLSRGSLSSLAASSEPTERPTPKPSFRD